MAMAVTEAVAFLTAELTGETLILTATEAFAAAAVLELVAASPWVGPSMRRTGSRVKPDARGSADSSK